MKDREEINFTVPKANLNLSVASNAPMATSPMATIPRDVYEMLNAGHDGEDVSLGRNGGLAESSRSGKE